MVSGVLTLRSGAGIPERVVPAGVPVARLGRSRQRWLTLRFRLRGRRRGVLGRMHNRDGEGKANFHHVIHEHFDEVNSRGGELDLRENGHVGGVMRGVLQGKLHLTFAQNRGLVRRNQAHVFRELADPGRPAVEDAELEGSDRYLRNANQSDNTHEDEIAIGFGTHVFAHQRTLQVRENSSCVHDGFRFREKALVPPHYLPAASSAARTVFCMSMAMVMGPTPPGLGVIIPAIGRTRAKSTSPTRRPPPRACGSGIRLTPTSTTTAPGFTMSALTNSATPMAAIKMSARRQWAARSRVCEWQRVTVALACLAFWIRMAAIGLPTMLPRPSTTTSAPSILTCERMSNSCTPAGVQGRKPEVSPSISLPTLTGWKPSTSFCGKTVA